MWTRSCAPDIRVSHATQMAAMMPPTVTTIGHSAAVREVVIPRPYDDRTRRFILEAGRCGAAGRPHPDGPTPEPPGRWSRL
jgi:hypothetical protein